MNRAQAIEYEPSGKGTRWTVAELTRPKRAYEPRTAIFERPVRPALRSAGSRALWQVICTTAEPLTKTAWIDRAGLHGKGPRTRADSAIHNMVQGAWVSVKRGFYAKRTGER